MKKERKKHKVTKAFFTIVQKKHRWSQFTFLCLHPPMSQILKEVSYQNTPFFSRFFQSTVLDLMAAATANLKIDWLLSCIDWLAFSYPRTFHVSYTPTQSTTLHYLQQTKTVFLPSSHTKNNNEYRIAISSHHLPHNILF